MWAPEENLTPDRQKYAMLHLAAFNESLGLTTVLDLCPNWTSLGIWLAERVSNQLEDVFDKIAALKVQHPEQEASYPQLTTTFRTCLDALVFDNIVNGATCLHDPVVEKVSGAGSSVVAAVRVPVRFNLRPSAAATHVFRLIIGKGERFDRYLNPHSSLLEAAEAVVGLDALAVTAAEVAAEAVPIPSSSG